MSSLRIAGVLPFVLGRLVSVLGRSMLSIAIGWQLYERTHSAFALGMVGSCKWCPSWGSSSSPATSQTATPAG